MPFDVQSANIEGPQILIVIGLAILVFGGKKIPELAKGLGEGIRNFKQSLKPEDEEKKDQPEAPKPQ